MHLRTAAEGIECMRLLYCSLSLLLSPRMLWEGYETLTLAVHTLLKQLDLCNDGHRTKTHDLKHSALHKSQVLRLAGLQDGHTLVNRRMTISCSSSTSRGRLQPASVNWFEGKEMLVLCLSMHSQKGKIDRRL